MESMTFTSISEDMEFLNNITDTIISCTDVKILIDRKVRLDTNKIAELFNTKKNPNIFIRSNVFDKVVYYFNKDRVDIMGYENMVMLFCMKKGIDFHNVTDTDYINAIIDLILQNHITEFCVNYIENNGVSLSHLEDGDIYFYI